MSVHLNKSYAYMVYSKEIFIDSFWTKLDIIWVCSTHTHTINTTVIQTEKGGMQKNIKCAKCVYYLNTHLSS